MKNIRTFYLRITILLSTTVLILAADQYGFAQKTQQMQDCIRATNNQSCLNYAMAKKSCTKVNLLVKPDEQNQAGLNYAMAGKSCTKVNQLNSKGLKAGLWHEGQNVYSYYKDGSRNGVYWKYYSAKGKLAEFGTYYNGEKVGKWYYFTVDRFLEYVVKDIRCNNEEVKNMDGSSYLKPEYRCHATSYYPNGEKKEEGEGLFYRNGKIIYFKIGKWKYYDNKGRLVEIRRHDKLPILRDEDVSIYPFRP